MARRIVTRRGIAFAFVLVFIHIKARRVHATRAPLAPDPAWTACEVATLKDLIAAESDAPELLIRDRDGKFGGAFEEELRANGLTSVMLPHWTHAIRAA